MRIHVFLAYWSESAAIAAGFKSVFDKTFDVRLINDISAVNTAGLGPGIRAATVVLIDKDWASRRRMKATDDVRHAISQALAQQDMLVIPVCVGSAAVLAELPGDIRGLSERAPMVLRGKPGTILGQMLIPLHAWAVRRRIKAELLPQRVPAWRNGVGAAATAVSLVALNWLGVLQLPGEIRLGAELARLQGQVGELSKERDALRIRERVETFEKFVQDTSEQLTAADKRQEDLRALFDTLSRQLAEARRDVDALSQRVAAAESMPQGTPPRGYRRDIVVLIDGVPPEYNNDQVVSRLVLSTLRGGILPDLIGIRHDPPATPSQRVVVLSVSGNAPDLTVGGQACRALPKCSLKLALRPLYVDLKAADPKAAASKGLDEPRPVAGIRLKGEKEEGFYSRLGVRDAALPAIKGPSGYQIVYLLKDARFRIDLKQASGDKAPYVDVIDGKYNVLQLAGEAPHWFIRLDDQGKLPPLPAYAAAGAP